ncbi:hypothetical protein [Clostridium vincentii]|uniref:Uncharacterized protein n=1 Tax=Clostridium vincentii TaxID=52704 RepID=A0A2T0B909_9CLOT|nr:hypothetical protein [Clostridium vincentii]PRR80370.1 hypothetical protein CLVI_30570 [Clostridium vincentii]
MELHITVKGQKEPIIFSGDRIDVLDFQLEGTKYKQIRYFRKGLSKSEYISEGLIKKMREINK